MSIEALDLIEKKDAPSETPDQRRRDRLNNAVAVTIALLATFMGICKVKDENICQAMQQAQVDRNDTWAWYQAEKVRKEVLGVAADEIRLGKDAAAAGAQADIAALADKFEKSSAERDKKLADLKDKAEGYAKAYDDLNFHDDQFDLMEAGLSIAISVLAIAALTSSFWLYYAALVPAAFGVLLGLAGMFNWNIHPDLLAKWLGS